MPNNKRRNKTKSESRQVKRVVRAQKPVEDEQETFDSLCNELTTGGLMYRPMSYKKQRRILWLAGIEFGKKLRQGFCHPNGEC